MSSLRKLQLGFMEAIFAVDSASFASEVVERGIPGERRLAVYHNNVFGGLTQTLRLTYPAIHVLVGEGFFRQMAGDYIHAYPSTSGDLTYFGRDFPAFLAGYVPVAELPYLSDMARLEWLCHTSYHAADHAPLALERLAHLPPERYDGLRFKLHPACRLLSSNYPLHHIWRICQTENDGVETVDLAAGGVDLLVQRSGLRVVPRPLGRSEFALLEAFFLGRRFPEACAAAQEAEPGFNLSDSLQRFVAQAIVVDFTE